MTDNPQPGMSNVEIVLNGTTYQMKPCYKAFQQINFEIPGGLVAALDKVGNADITALETIIAAGVGFTTEGRKKLGDWIFEAGINNLTTKAIKFLTVLANGGIDPDLEKEEKANETSGGKDQ